MALTLAEANQVMQRLIAFNRMDGASWASAYGSQGKAIASAGFARPSGELAERAGSPIIQGIAAAEGGHMIPSQGAVPIIRNGVVDGACGVGGAPPSRTRTARARESRNSSSTPPVRRRPSPRRARR